MHSNVSGGSSSSTGSSGSVTKQEKGGVTIVEPVLPMFKIPLHRLMERLIKRN